jgi:hypothetical protein
MSSTLTTFMGIDPSIHVGLIAYAVIDQHLHPIEVGSGDLDRVMTVVEERGPTMIGIGAPPRLNHGIVADPQKRAKWGIPPRRGRPMDCRVGEYELLQRGVDIYRTPSQAEKAKPWMQTGFKIYKRLEAMGFRAYKGTPGDQQFIEVPSETCYWIWLEREPIAADTFGGRLQRQLVLYESGLDVPDAMLLLEEITRHRLLQGFFVEEGLYMPAELQALAAATIAWAVIQRPEEVALIGDSEEGQVTVPNKFEHG